MELLVTGQNATIRLPTGRVVRPIRLNNAATTPPFVAVMRKVNSFVEEYGAIERGAGPFAEKSADEFERSVQQIKSFIDAGSRELLFSSNTTAAINVLSRMLALNAKDVLLTSEIEHTSNYLPWKFNSKARLEFFSSRPDGSFELDDLEEKIEKLNPSLVSITGAHSLTGYVPPLHRIAKKVHEAGGKLFVDCAQLASHRALRLQANDVDFAAFSAHKLYAPFGVGVLAVRPDSLDCLPSEPGGGTIDMVNEGGEVLWKKGIRHHQSGTLNSVGVVALAESTRVFEKLGWEKIRAQEEELIRLLLERISRNSKLRQYVPRECYAEGRTGNVVFNIEGLHHALVSAVLANEYGIETRAGTICNHRLVRRWMNVSPAEQRRVEKEIAEGNLLASYGIVRASIGIQNSEQDIEALAGALANIARNGPALKYAPIPGEETFKPA